MGRYLVLWEAESVHESVDAQQRLAGWQASNQIILKGLESGMIKEWGIMLGLHKGFGVYEGSELEVAAFLAQFAPWYRSEAHVVLSAQDCTKMVDLLTP